MYKIYGVLLLLTFISGCATTKSFHELHSEGLNDLKLYRYEWALESLLAAEKINNSHKIVKYDISYVLYKLGRYDDAITYTNRVLEIDPSYYKALRRKAISLRRLGKYEESSEIYQKLLEIDPNDYISVSIIARNRYDQNNYKQCIVSIKKFTEIISGLNRSDLPEKEKKAIRNIEKDMNALNKASSDRV